MLEVGNVINVVHHSDAQHLYKILEIGIENDGRGQIKLSTLEENIKGYPKKTFKENEKTMVVDILWFDQKLTGRKIKKIDE